MARLSTKPVGTCERCRRFYSYRRVLGLVLCASCGRRAKAEAKALEARALFVTDDPIPGGRR